MSEKPKLAIVGRPNVGKSALFNRICRTRIAIVDEKEGITRDRIYADAEIFGLSFEVIDTGGVDPRSQADFAEEVKRQTEIAIEEATTLVMVVDAHVGITALDEEVAKLLLRTQKPVCLAVNKVDHPSEEHLLHQFHALGIRDIVAVSAAHGWNIAELLETAFSQILQNDRLPTTEKNDIKAAIVGRPNVGKSSLVNFLLNQDRCIVSPLPGTTRDSLDIALTCEGQQYTLIDTAGIRRKHAEHEVVDKFATIRTKRAIERADICLLMLDSQQGMTAQEKKIAKMIEEAGKGCLLLFNKWDLVQGFRMEHCSKNIDHDVAFLKHCPKLFISAKTGRNLGKIFPLVKDIYEEGKKKIPTPKLNKFIETSLQKNHPPMVTGKRLRIYYMTQVNTQPPEFVLFVNIPALMTDSYKKYLQNQLREHFPFQGVPISFSLRGKEQN